MGILLGLSYSIYLDATYSRIQDVNQIKKTQQGSIIKISQKSMVIEYEYKQKKYRLRVLTDTKKSKLLKGDKILFSCHKIFSKQKNLFTFTQDLQKISQTCRGLIQKEKKFLHSPLEKLSIWVTAWLKNRLKQFPEGSLAEGFILADTTQIPRVEMQFFRKMGIAHLFAASGLHLGLLFAICYLPFLWLNIPRYGEVLGLLFCTFFLILLDFPISLLRAYLFLVVYLTLKLIDRKTSPFYIYFFVACFSEWFNPLSAFSYSFILSFGITGIILLTFPFFKEILPIGWSYLRDHLALTLAAFTGSLFLSALLFGYVNVLSLLYNFLLVPFASIYLLLTLLSIIFPLFSSALSLLDQIFYWSVQVHQNIWERFFTTINLQITTIWLSLIFALFTVICLLMLNKRKWYVKRWFLPVGVVSLLLYYVQFFSVHYPRFGFKAFPYGVLFYQNKELYIFGKLASFIKEGGERFFIRPEVPIDKIYVSSLSLMKFVKKNTALSSEKKYPLSFRREWNVLKLKSHCFLFMSRKFKIKYAYKNTKSCSSIYIITSKKRKQNLRLAHRQLRQMRKNVHIVTNTYNRWYWSK